MVAEDPILSDNCSWELLEQQAVKLKEEKYFLFI